MAKFQIIKRFQRRDKFGSSLWTASLATDGKQWRVITRLVQSRHLSHTMQLDEEHDRMQRIYDRHLELATGQTSLHF